VGTSGFFGNFFYVPIT